MWFFWCILRLWATADYCRAGIKSLRGTSVFFFLKFSTCCRNTNLDYTIQTKSYYFTIICSKFRKWPNTVHWSHPLPPSEQGSFESVPIYSSSVNGHNYRGTDPTQHHSKKSTQYHLGASLDSQIYFPMLYHCATLSSLFMSTLKDTKDAAELHLYSLLITLYSLFVFVFVFV